MLSKIKKSWTTRKNIRGRSGSMLLLVLIIMAVAVILFASALMIADATRLRYYKSAEQEQASLTAMSAAKLIGTAATNGKIPVSDLVYLADSESTVPISSTGLNIPGLSDTTNSKTSAKFGYYPSKTDKKYISITVTTVLNVLNAETSSAASSEVATVLLEKVPISSKPFANLITMGIDDLSHPTKNVINKLYISTTYYTNDNSDDVVVNGDVAFQSLLSSPTVNCNIVFTGDVQVTGIDDHDSTQIFNGNVALYGDDASIMNGQGLASSKRINIGGNLFFFRKTQGTVFTDWLGNRCNITTSGPTIKVNNAAKGVYLLNSSLNSTNVYTTGGIVVGSNSLVNPANSKLAIDPLKTSLAADADSLYDKLSIAVSRKVLMTADAKSLFPCTTDSQVTALSTKILNTAADETIVTPGSYYINLASSSELSKNLTFNLAAGDCTLYIIDTPAAGRDLLVTGSIKFINGDPNNDGVPERVGKILLLDGADMTLGTQEGWDFHYASITGIKVLHAGTPFLFIFGLGDREPNNPNKISIVNGDIEAFIGLYGTLGNLSLDNLSPCYPKNKVSLYVRYEGAFIDKPEFCPNCYPDLLTFPYCPPPAEGALSGLGFLNSVTYQSAGYIVGPAT